MFWIGWLIWSCSLKSSASTMFCESQTVTELLSTFWSMVIGNTSSIRYCLLGTVYWALSKTLSGQSLLNWTVEQQTMPLCRFSKKFLPIVLVQHVQWTLFTCSPKAWPDAARKSESKHCKSIDSIESMNNIHWISSHFNWLAFEIGEQLETNWTATDTGLCLDDGGVSKKEILLIKTSLSYQETVIKKLWSINSWGCLPDNRASFYRIWRGSKRCLWKPLSRSHSLEATLFQLRAIVLIWVC